VISADSEIARKAWELKKEEPLSQIVAATKKTHAIIQQLLRQLPKCNAKLIQSGRKRKLQSSSEAVNSSN
jgi:hypothetical protein